MSQSAGRSPVLLAGFVILFTLILGGAAYGLNRIVNPPPASVSSGCPAAPSGHPATNATHTYSQVPPSSLDAKKSYTAVFCTTRGVIKFALRSHDAPQTVNAFVYLADNGYYDGLTFHRVCPSSTDSSCGPVGPTAINIAQGGDPNGDGTGKGPGFVIPDETPVGSYGVGTLALARPASAQGAKIPNSSGGQFFIDTGDNSAYFTPDYNLFGDLTTGLDVAKRLVKGDTIFWIAIETGTAPAPSPSPSAAASASPSAAASPAATSPAPSPS